MLLKNARIAFNDSLLNPKVVGHLGSVGPITDFTPQASRSLPARLGGTGADGRDFGPQSVNYHLRAFPLCTEVVGKET